MRPDQAAGANRSKWLQVCQSALALHAGGNAAMRD
jgi:hypothetical protein